MRRSEWDELFRGRPTRAASPPSGVAALLLVVALGAVVATTGRPGVTELAPRPAPREIVTSPPLAPDDGRIASPPVTAVEPPEAPPSSAPPSTVPPAATPVLVVADRPASPPPTPPATTPPAPVAPPPTADRPSPPPAPPAPEAAEPPTDEPSKPGRGTEAKKSPAAGSGSSPATAGKDGPPPGVKPGRHSPTSSKPPGQ